jgi:hypothetical protein
VIERLAAGAAVARVAQGRGGHLGDGPHVDEGDGRVGGG